MTATGDRRFSERGRGRNRATIFASTLGRVRVSDVDRSKVAVWLDSALRLP
jgi:hypothetical protein